MNSLKHLSVSQLLNPVIEYQSVTSYIYSSDSTLSSQSLERTTPGRLQQPSYTPLYPNALSHPSPPLYPVSSFSSSTFPTCPESLSPALPSNLGESTIPSPIYSITSPIPISYAPCPVLAPEAKRKRSQLTKAALAYLKDYFSANKFPDIDQRLAIAIHLNILPRSIQNWFQNRRQVFKAGMEEKGFLVPKGRGKRGGEYQLSYETEFRNAEMYKHD